MENYKYKKDIKKLWNYISKWKKAVIKIVDIEVEKQKFHQHKRPISIKNVDINAMVVSNEVCFGKKGC